MSLEEEEASFSQQKANDIIKVAENVPVKNPSQKLEMVEKTSAKVALKAN